MPRRQRKKERGGVPRQDRKIIARIFFLFFLFARPVSLFRLLAVVVMAMMSFLRPLLWFHRLVGLHRVSGAPALVDDDVFVRQLGDLGNPRRRNVRIRFRDSARNAGRRRIRHGSHVGAERRLSGSVNRKGAGLLEKNKPCKEHPRRYSTGLSASFS
jgi:hypothetical protein